jgi:hypothetical protein
MSVLISDLQTIPGIIGSLGLGIADAQKEMNADYMRSISALLEMVIRLPADDPANPQPSLEIMRNLLVQLAPPRYQFTRTELQVRLDLAQTKTRTEGLALGGVALGAVAVNGSFALGFTQDYRAAAECHTVLDAMLPTGNNDALFRELFASVQARAPQELPAEARHDKEILDLAREVASKLGLVSR